MLTLRPSIVSSAKFPAEVVLYPQSIQSVLFTLASLLPCAAIPPHDSDGPTGASPVSRLHRSRVGLKSVMSSFRCCRFFEDGARLWDSALVRRWVVRCRKFEGVRCGIRFFVVFVSWEVIVQLRGGEMSGAYAADVGCVF